MIAVFMMAFITSATAQAMQEVVYLKNGSVIKGVVIEQTPGVALKIKTYDGSIFVYSMSDVEKITKEEITPMRNNYSYRNATPKVNGYNSFQPKYRGFADFGFTFGVGKGVQIDRVDVFTSHGVQVIPQLFIGAGVGFNTSFDWIMGLPLYFDVRTDILQSYITPFIDLKIGYSPINGENTLNGFFFSPTIGCKINRFNIGLGYVLQRADVFIYNYNYTYRANCGGISIKFGYEF